MNKLSALAILLAITAPVSFAQASDNKPVAEIEAAKAAVKEDVAALKEDKAALKDAKVDAAKAKHARKAKRHAKKHAKKEVGEVETPAVETK